MKIRRGDRERLAREAHRKAVLEKVTEQPEVFAKGLLLNPELTAGVQDIEEVFSMLLSKEQKDVLEVLLRHPRLSKRAQSVLASVLLLG